MKISKIKDAVWRGFLGIGRAATAWIPSSVLLFMSGVYLFSCLEVLAAPGTGFEFVYMGQSGPVKITAETYAIDPVGQSLEAYNVQVFGLAGEQIGRAGKLRVVRSAGTMRVDVRDVDAVIRRRKDGSFNTFDLLQPFDPNAKPQATFVRLDRVDVRLIDETLTPVLSDDFELRGVDFSTDGRLNVIAADLEWADVLTARVGGTLGEKNAFDVQFEDLKAELRSARPTVERWLPVDVVRDFRAWDADKLTVEGEVSVAGNEKGVSDFRGQLAVSGEGVRHADLFDRSRLTATVDLFPTALGAIVRLEGPGQVVTWDGSVSWARKLAASGTVKARVRDRQSAWKVVRPLIPQDIRFGNGEFDGVVALRDDQFSASGNWAANRLEAAGEAILNPQGTVIANSELTSLVLDRATWRGTEINGWLTANYKGEFLTGLVNTERDRLVRLEVPFEGGKVTMAGRSQILISGTPARPEVLVDLTGFANLGLPEREVLLGEVDARLIWKNGVAVVTRGVLSGPNGTASFGGTVSTDRQELNLSLDLAGIDISAWQDQIQGVAYGSGRLTGKFSDPQLNLETTVLNIQANEFTLPKAEGVIRYGDGRVVVSDVVVAYGLGSVSGDAQIDLKTQAVSGLLTAQDIFVADLVPTLPIVGRIGSDSIVLSGTVSEPQITASVTGEEILASGVPLNRLKADLRLVGTQVSVLSGQAEIGEGRVEATGQIDLSTMIGRGRAEIFDVSMDVLPVDRELVEVTGLVSGVGDFQAKGEKNFSGAANLRFSGLRVNDFDAGSGQIVALLEDDTVKLSGGLSSLQGLVEVPQAEYELSTGDLSGELWLTNLELAGVLRAARKKIQLPDLQAERVVRDLQGLVTGEFVFEQEAGEWSVDVRTFSGQRLVSLGRQLGTLDLRGTGSQSAVTVAELKWTVPDEEGEGESITQLQGSWRKDGDKDVVDVAGRFVEFDPYVLSLLIEDAPEFHARVNADVVVAGPTKALEGQASAQVGGLQLRNEEGRLVDVPVSANLGEILFSNNVLDVVGKLRLQGIEGDLTARVPLSAFDENPTEKATAAYDLGRRELSFFGDYLTGLDLEKSQGVISGRLGVEGDRAGFKLSGQADFAGDVAFKGSTLALNGAKLGLRLSDSRVVLEGDANGSLGGTVAVAADVNLRRFLQGDYTFEALSEATFEGTAITFNELAFAEKIRLANPAAAPGEPAFLEATSPTQGMLDGSVRIAGTVNDPVIQGEIRGSNLNVSLPPAFPEGGSEPAAVGGPRFEDFRLVALPGATLNIPLGNLKLSGSAVLNGTLSSLEVRAPFTVDSGSLTLPSSRVTLDEGTVVVTTGFGGEARAEVNLNGWTVVTARREAGDYQTYRLNLQVQGNLLDPEGVRINGSSDPPDLSIEEIRAIIGQRDFIESLVGSALGTSDRSGLTGSIFSLALPSLTESWTGELAKALDLDYLALDYNPFDGAIARAGREFAQGLFLEASRQITAQGNEPIKFELRLSYRPPTKNKFLSRSRISISTTEQLPWRVGITWTSRF